MDALRAGPSLHRPPEEGAPSSSPNTAWAAGPAHDSHRATALPRRHLGSCHVLLGAGRGRAPESEARVVEDFYPRGRGALPQPRSVGVSLTPKQGSRVSGARKTASPSGTPPAAGRAQASRMPSPTRGSMARAARPRYLRHGLSRWGVPLQSLVLLPPLQRPMLPQALLPLIRHGGCGPWGSGGGRTRTRTGALHL